MATLQELPRFELLEVPPPSYLEPPKRMVDVGPKDGSQDPRLIVSDILSESYVALSYCWGIGENFITTQSNIQDMTAGFRFERLPRTIQDAILVTRCLGIRYIWIDCLSIVQDDYKDWEEESAKMATVYQSAVLTISATNASGVDDGFLRPRDKIYKKTVQHISWRTSSGETREVHLRTRLAHSDIVPEVASTHRRRTSCSQPNPLLSRGRAFQERILSTRTLHFLSQELLWECKCDFWCECMSVSSDQSFKTGIVRGSLYSKALADPSRLVSARMSPTVVWQTLVSEYSKRQLTYCDDKLPALSGIARRFISFGMGEYWAGHWQKNFLCQLVWQTDLSSINSSPSVFRSSHPPKNQPPSLLRKIRGMLSLDNPRSMTSGIKPFQRKLSQLEPSWSWISTDLPIEWSSYADRVVNHDDVIGFRPTIQLYDADAFGKVKGAELIISGYVGRSTIQSSQANIHILEKCKVPDSHHPTLIPDLGSDSGFAVGDEVSYILIHSTEKGGLLSWVALAILLLPPNKAAKQSGDKPASDADHDHLFEHDYRPFSERIARKYIRVSLIHSEGGVSFVHDEGDYDLPTYKSGERIITII